MIMFGGILSIIDKIKIENIIIGKQFIDTENIDELLKCINNKKINLIILQKGDRIYIEKNVYIDVLWPYSENIINDNKINNNSLVFKLVYNKSSILFTGDIEKTTEIELLKLYNSEILHSNILKVAHHGSRSSSTLEFLEKVMPEIALIGVRCKQ